MQTNCFVTGAAGFIGSHLVDALLARGANVTGIDNLKLGRRENLAPALQNPRFKFFEADLNDLAACGKIISSQSKGVSITEAWHMAANSDIRAGGADSDVDFRDTFLTTYNLLKLMREHKIPRLAFASTSAIYGDLKQKLTEDIGPLFPISNYGAMKLASEAAISAAAESFLERAWIFRFPNVVGSRATHGAIFDFCHKLKNNPSELEVLGDGTQEKPYFHVADLIDAMLFITDNAKEKLNFFNIGTSDDVTTVDYLAETTIRIAAPKAKIRYTGGNRGWVGDVPKVNYSVEKLKKLGWSPRLTSNQAVDRAVAEIVAEIPDMARQLIILAGGAGTRLRARLGYLPKPMIPIAGKPLLEHQIELARRHGFTDLIFFIHYRADLIEKHFGNGEKFGVQIRYILEREPLGTAGAVFAGMELLADRFVVMYGDTMVNVDLDRIWNAHDKVGAAATLLLHPNDHPFDSDLVEVDAESRVVAFHNRPHAENIWRQNLVNAGLYVLEKSALQKCADVKPAKPASKIKDFGKDVFPALVARGERLLGYLSPEFIKDIGTPERYDKITAQFDAGIVQRSSLATPQRAVFLDRDGTLNVDKDCLRSADELELLPGVAKALRELNLHGWRMVVVTNQPVIAKGFCNEAELQQIHNKLESLLGREHAFLDRIYFCPHHPEKGFPGERRELKIECDCRKPKTGMIQKAVVDLNIDLKQSWLIGDTTTDLQTAKNAGLKSILVRTGASGRDGKFAASPDFVFDTLPQAVDFIVSHKS